MSTGQVSETSLALAVQGREQAPASYADYLTLVQQGPSAFVAPARAGSPGGEVGSSASVPVSADGAAPLPAPTGQLALDFGAPDADGTPLHSGIVASNSSHQFKGKAPYQVRIGYATGSEISFNGQAIDIKNHFVDGKTVALTVPQP